MRNWRSGRGYRRSSVFKENCLETGEDGREVLKIMYAAYQSAGEGRKIEWPYTPLFVKKPIDLWKK
jgi:hypothetical protein